MEDRLTQYLIKAKRYLNKDPKRFYKYAMTVLFISLVFAIISAIVLKPKTGIKHIPFDFMEHQKMPNQSNSNENELKRIVNELEVYKVKRENEELTEQDSVRIEYLYNKFQKLKNE